MNYVTALPGWKMGVLWSGELTYRNVLAWRMSTIGVCDYARPVSLGIGDDGSFVVVDPDGIIYDHHGFKLADDAAALTHLKQYAERTQHDVEYQRKRLAEMMLRVEDEML